jgi:hypothetical protein
MRRSKIASAMPLLVTFMVVVIVATFSVLAFRLFIQNKVNPYLGSFAGAVVNAMTIIFMNVFWKTVALKLTEWENHRTQSEFDNSLITKIFAFYFINSYTSLYYIAFFKSRTRIFAVNALQDKCKVGLEGETISGGCLDELSVQLATILGVNMVFGQAREVAIPWLISKIKLKMYEKKAGEEKNSIPQWERESKFGQFPGTFDEYSEMIIQYGYITLFASAFPIAPLMAVINNVIEIRTDAFKLLSAYTRPEYQGAQTIGTWFQILELLGVLSVITNCLLIGFTFQPIYELLQFNSFETLAVIVIVEHTILFLKYIIAVAVPDYPGWIVKEQAKDLFIKEETVKNLKAAKSRAAMAEAKKHGDLKAHDDKEEGGKTLDL